MFTQVITPSVSYFGKTQDSQFSQSAANLVETRLNVLLRTEFVDANQGEILTGAAIGHVESRAMTRMRREKKPARYLAGLDVDRPVGG